MQNDKKKERVKQLREEGFTYEEISKYTDLSESLVRAIINPHRVKKAPLPKNLASFFNFDEVVALLKQKKENSEISKILKPDVDIQYFYAWKLTLTEQQQKIIKGFSTFARSHKLKEPTVERKFKYKETPNNIALPRGA